MSILTEYDDIRKAIGDKKFDAIDIYLKTLYSKEDMDNYVKELKNIRKLPIEKMIEEKKKLENKYNIIFLSDVLFNHDCWKKFDKWYNEQYLKRKVDIIDTWTSDYDDIRCNAKLYENSKEVANIIASYDETDLRYSIGNKDSEMNDKFVTRAFKCLINYDFDNFLKLPKVSKCSRLLQEIYDNVCESDATMCHISYEDWDNYYADNYFNSDLEVLKKEIKKYGLEDVIEIDTGEYKIIGYGDLETRFNDDRNINKILVEEDDFVI